METGRLAFLFILILSLFFLVKPSFSIWSSPLLAFNVTPNTVYLNWTNNYQANVTIFSNGTNIITNTSNITIEVFNTTSSFTANYSQYNGYSSCLNNAHNLLIQNASTYSNISGTINGSDVSGNNVNLTLIYNTSSSVHPCSPGRYWLGNLTIRNYTNSSEQAYASVILDVP